MMLNNFMAIESNAVFSCSKRTFNSSSPAIIPVCGVLTKRPTNDFECTTSYEEIHHAITEALANPDIARIILDIDSPGGEVSGLFDLCDFIKESCKIKPIIAYANDYCFSAAYAIAASCSKILINRTSGVGSIGVIATHVDISGYDQKEGLKYTTIFEGARKNDLNPHEALSDEAIRTMKTELSRLYDMFVEHVAKSRGLTVEIIRSTEAGIFYGEDAIKTGLADEVISSFKMENFMEKELEKHEPEVLLETPEENDYKDEISEIARLCKLARMPEKLAEFVESGTSLEGARDSLMKALASKSEDIRSTISVAQKQAESPMIAAAKARLTRI